MGEVTVGERPLCLALANYPSWMADDLRTWIRAEEAKGQRFTSARSAVRHAVDYVSNI